MTITTESKGGHLCVLPLAKKAVPAGGLSTFFELRHSL